MSELIDRTCGSYLVLVAHHVPQSNVVDHADEDVRVQWPAIDAAVHRLGTVVIEVGLFQQFAVVLVGCVLFGELERCRILLEKKNGQMK